MNDQPDVTKRRRYLWGMLLAWIPIVIFLTPSIVVFLQVMATNKATGIGAVAGGLTEAFVLFGVLSMLALQVSAIVLLTRSFGSGNGLRSLSAALSIVCSGLMIVFVGLSIWMVHWISHRLQP